jgi:membrane protein DedA with SNARE-associated domain
VFRAANWWAAMGIIFLCLSAIVTWGAYSVSPIQQIEARLLKWVLTIVVLGVGLFIFVLVCEWIWLRKDIN